MQWQDSAALGAAGNLVSALPGTLYVHPRREDAEKDPNAFYELLEWSRIHEKFSRIDLGKVLGDTEPNVEQRMGRRVLYRTFDERAQRVILGHLFDERSDYARKARARLRDEPHALYYALLNFFGIPETTQDNARAAILGTYQFWRYSIGDPNEVVCGKLLFYQPKGTRVVAVRMWQAAQPADGSRGASAQAEGHIFRIGKVYVMILSDPTNHALRVTILSSFHADWVGTGPGGDHHSDPKSVYSGRHQHLVLLDGHVFGTDGNKVFLSPIHLSLVDNVDELAKLDGRLDVMPLEDRRIPRRVRQKLKNAGGLQILCG